MDDLFMIIYRLIEISYLHKKKKKIVDILS